jgi:hypothetical protein
MADQSTIHMLSISGELFEQFFPDSTALATTLSTIFPRDIIRIYRNKDNIYRALRMKDNIFFGFYVTFHEILDCEKVLSSDIFEEILTSRVVNTLRPIKVQVFLGTWKEFKYILKILANDAAAKIHKHVSNVLSKMEDGMLKENVNYKSFHQDNKVSCELNTYGEFKIEFLKDGTIKFEFDVIFKIIEISKIDIAEQIQSVLNSVPNLYI